MDFLWESITSWLKEVLVSGIISNLSGLFDTMNEQVGEIATQVGATPENWNSGIFQWCIAYPKQLYCRLPG